MENQLKAKTAKNHLSSEKMASLWTPSEKIKKAKGAKKERVTRKEMVISQIKGRAMRRVPTNLRPKEKEMKKALINQRERVKVMKRRKKRRRTWRGQTMI